MIDKEKLYIKKRWDTKNSALKVYRKYTKEAKGSNQRGMDKTKKITCPYLESNQSMKLTSEKWLKSIDTLTQDQMLHTKEFFNLWSKGSSLPNTNKFLSFQIVQNIYKGAACQAFL